MKKLWCLIATVVLLSVLVACAPAAAPTVIPAAPPRLAVVTPTPAPRAAVPGGYAGEGVVPIPVTERMIIHTVDLGLVVEDAGESLERIKALATRLGGYVASSNMWREEEQLRGTVTIRVPAESLDQVVAELKGLAIEVERESSSGQDVTEEYTDLEAQLRNLRATENELLELLKTVRERSQKAEDILAVHRDLTNIRGQIERLQGRMQYLERMTALATINVELIPEELERPVVEPGWAPLRTLRDAARALVNTLKLLVDAVIWVVVVALPILLLLFSPFLVGFWVWRRRRRVEREKG